MLHKSIRWRIQLWHGALLLCLVTGMLAAFYLYARAEKFRIIDNQLQTLLTPLLPKVTQPHHGFDRRPPPPPGMEEGPDDQPPPRRQARENFSEFENSPYYFAVWSPNGEITRHSTNAPMAQIPPPEPGHSQDRETFRSHGDFRELEFFGPEDTCVMVGASTAEIARELRHLAWTLVAVGLGLCAFGLAGGWWVAGYALRPIGEISETARQITGGNRSKRIDVRDTESELGQLAETLNHTFDQQDSAFDQQVRFTADASHELRTPVSVILTQVQVALNRERDAGEYRETLRVCQRAAERMRHLINSLLELARVDSGEFQLKLDDCNLSEVAAESLDLVAPLALEKNVILRSSVQPVHIRADAAKLGQVVVNLLYNAIHHNASGVEVRLVIQTENASAILRVEDNGVGIPSEALPHIFERFFRADKSRTGTKSGSGLGLAISQAIIKAHGGTLCVESQPGKGAIFTATLPISA
jgi:heavy metal sensor kinase